MIGGAGKRSGPDVDTARRLCESFYCTPVSVEALPGYDDTNFRIVDATGQAFVLKLAAESTSRDLLEMQDRVLAHLSSLDGGWCPTTVRSRVGRTVESVELSGTNRLVRMLTYLPGLPMAALDRRSPDLLSELGDLLGRMDRALGELHEPAARRWLEWDLARLEEIPSLAEALPSDSDRRLAEEMINRYIESRQQRLDDLRRHLIQGDANDYNVIVTATDSRRAGVVGLIDFGDLVESDLVCELAVAMAYAGSVSDRPWQAALPVLTGYQQQLPLREPELELLFPAVCARLAQSVCMSARRRAEGSADEYVVIFEKSAWSALGALSRVNPNRALEAARRSIRGIDSDD